MIRVMIADDEPIVRKALSTLISWNELGCELVFSATNGQEVLDNMENARPDIIITDIRMPLLDGLSLLERLRTAGNHVPVIVLTAYADFSYAKQSLQYNVVDYIVKTAMLDALPAAIEKAKLRLASVPIPAKEDSSVQLFLRDVFDGSFQGEDELIVGKQTLALGDYRVVLVCCDSLRNTNLHSMLVDCAQAVFDSSLIACASVRKNRLMLITDDVGGAFSHCQQYIEMTAQFLREPLTIGASEMHNGMQELRQAISEVRSSFGRNFYAKSGQVTPYEPEARPSPHVLQAVQAQLQAVRESLPNEETAQSAFKAAMAEWRQSYVSSAEVKNACMLLLADCVRLRGDSLTESDTQALMTATHIDSVEKLMTDCICQTAAQMAAGSETSNLVAQVLSYIEAHFEEPLQVGAIAKALHTNPSYLSRVFKTQMGSTIISAIGERKMLLAKRALSNSSQRISEIADKLGFENITYFSRFFKKHAGVSPREYRERNQIERNIGGKTR